MAPYEFFDHAADVGIRISAQTLAEVYREAGRALMTWIGPTPESGECFEECVALEAEAAEEMLVRWLQELLYLFHARSGYLMEVPRLDLQDRKLAARLRLRRWGPDAAASFQEVKAVTYHGLRLQPSGGTWEAIVILDI